MKIYENTRFQEYTWHKKSRNVIFLEKKAPAAVHHTHTGHKNPRNVTFSEKNAPAPDFWNMLILKMYSLCIFTYHVDAFHYKQDRFSFGIN